MLAANRWQPAELLWYRRSLSACVTVPPWFASAFWLRPREPRLLKTNTMFEGVLHHHRSKNDPLMSHLGRCCRRSLVSIGIACDL